MSTTLEGKRASSAFAKQASAAFACSLASLNDLRSSAASPSLPLSKHFPSLAFGSAIARWSSPRWLKGEMEGEGEEWSRLSLCLRGEGAAAREHGVAVSAISTLHSAVHCALQVLILHHCRSLKLGVPHLTHSHSSRLFGPLLPLGFIFPYSPASAAGCLDQPTLLWPSESHEFHHLLIATLSATLDYSPLRASAAKIPKWMLVA